MEVLREHIGCSLYIQPVQPSIASAYSNQEYTLIAVDDHGLWLESETMRRVDGSVSAPIRLMEWRSVGLYSLDFTAD